MLLPQPRLRNSDVGLVGSWFPLTCQATRGLSTAMLSGTSLDSTESSDSLSRYYSLVRQHADPASHNFSSGQTDRPLGHQPDPVSAQPPSASATGPASTLLDRLRDGPGQWIPLEDFVPLPNCLEWRLATEYW